MAQQTAVEWLWNLSKQRELDKFDLEQAKEMEKEQIEQAFIAGDCGYSPDDGNIERMADEYYNETYNK